MGHSVMKMLLLLLGQYTISFVLVYRKDKWCIILKVIIRTFKNRVLWGLELLPIGRKRGTNSAPILQICSHLKFGLSNLCEQCTIRILVEVRN